MANGGILGGAKRDVDLCGKGHVTLIPVCAVCTTSAGATVTPVSNLEFPFRVMVRRAFVCAISAFGSGHNLVVAITDGTNTETLTSADDVKVVETKTGTTILDKDTDISITAALEGSGTPSVTNILVFFEQVDEFNDPG
jgi:hypothetical protein